MTPMTPTTLPEFLTSPTLRLILFGGKGGVGKTTTSLASAIHLARARPSNKILIVSTDPAHSLLDAVAGSTLPANLTPLEFNADELHVKFMTEHGGKLREIAARGTFLDKDDIDRFLSLSVPGLDELMAYVQISTWLTEKTYDTIVVDTAPTGHTLRLLAMPAFVDGWLGAMDALLAKHRFMLKAFGGRKTHDAVEDFLDKLGLDLRRPTDILTDRAQCRFVPVMLPEAMSVEETTDLVTALTNLNISHPELIINRVMPADVGTVYQALRDRQSGVLNTLPDVITSSRVWVFPHATTETRGADILSTLWDSAIPLEHVLSRPRVAPASPAQAVFEVVGHVSAPPANIRLMLFAGKGGVGKTTMACATAIALSRRLTRKTLLVSTDPAHSTADCLQCPVGPTPDQIDAHLWALEINAEKEFITLRDLYRDEVEQLLSAILPGMDLSFDKDVMQRVLDLAPPGLDEVMALIRVTELMEGNKFDLIILDTAPTGHLLRLLELPHIIEQWTQAVFKVILKFDKIIRLPKVTAELIRISRGIKKLRAVLVDAGRCRLHAVTIPTEMALAETSDLIARSRTIGLSLGELILNQVAPPGATDLERALYDADSQMVTKFMGQFPELSPAVVYRRSEPRGVETLAKFGEILHQSPGQAKVA